MKITPEIKIKQLEKKLKKIEKRQQNIKDKTKIICEDLMKGFENYSMYITSSCPHCGRHNSEFQVFNEREFRIIPHIIKLIDPELKQ